MRKKYFGPTTEVVRLQPQRLLSGSEVGGVNGNSCLGYGGGGSEDARARGFVDDEWED